MRIYVGLNHSGLLAIREVFKAETLPTTASHGDKYRAVIGPFRTMRGANFCRDHGFNNPHVQNVADAERIAKEEAAKKG